MLGKVVLHGISFFWIHLFHIAQAIINRINSIIARFLWSGVGNHTKIHLIGLDSISWLVHMGRWGVPYVRYFNLDPLATNIWWVFNIKGLWKEIIFAKYSNNQSGGLDHCKDVITLEDIFHLA